MKKYILSPVLLIALSAVCLLYAQEMLPAKIQAVLIFKTLGYVKNVSQISSGGKILFGILYDDNIASRTYSKDILENILAAKSAAQKVQNLEIEPLLFKFDKEVTLLDSLVKSKVKVLYVITQSDENLKVILGVTKQLKILSMTGVKTEENVKNGVSIGLGMIDNKPVIMANTKSIKGEEKEFAKDFYPLTKIVD